jgi:hypothetical protein
MFLGIIQRGITAIEDGIRRRAEDDVRYSIFNAPYIMLTIPRYMPNVTPLHILIIAATSSNRSVPQVRAFFSRHVNFETLFTVSLVSEITTVPRRWANI